MKITKFKKVSNDKYKVFLENGEVITLFEDIIINNNLLITKEILEEEKDSILKENNNYDAYNLALKYLSIKMRSKKEVVEYLSKKDISNENINGIIERLEKNNFINDRKYAEAYIKDQINLSNNGPYKIKNILINLGVKEDIINEILSYIDSNIIKEKLTKLINKQLKIKKGSKNMLKIKLVNYFSNLGYDKGLILDILNNSDIKTNGEELKKEYNKLYSKYSKKYEGNELKYFIEQKLYQKGYTKEEIKNTEY